MENPPGSALGLSLVLRLYFIIYPSSCHNTDPVILPADLEHSAGFLLLQLAVSGGSNPQAGVLHHQDDFVCSLRTAHIEETWSDVLLGVNVFLHVDEGEYFLLEQPLVLHLLGHLLVEALLLLQGLVQVQLAGRNRVLETDFLYGRLSVFDLLYFIGDDSSK